MGSLIAVEPSGRCAHPRNAALLRFLKKTALQGTGDAVDLEGYELHAHPDLCEDLQAFNPRCAGAAYGIPVPADESGVLFAVARGASIIAFQLPEPERSEAKAAGGTDFPEAGDDRIAVDGWRTDKDRMAKWRRAAHAYANKIGKGKTA